MAGSAAPYVVTINGNQEPAAAAAAASQALRAPIAGTVTGVTYIPEATITGVATNNRTIQVVNRLQDGTGNVVVATLTFNAGVNAAAYDETSLTLQAAANLTVAEGDVLEFRSTANGTGIADPGGRVGITISR